MAEATPEFRPAWWLRNPHLQTLWPALLRRAPRLALQRERIELPDGDFLDLDWAAPPGRALVLVVHGLEGSSRSGYARGMMAAAVAHGWGAATMNFRGCSGTHNRLDRSYHSGETGDLAHVVERLSRRFRGLPIAAVGYSLGGNALLKWLGETGAACPLAAAVAVSVPLQLDRAAERMSRGLSRLYQWRLIRSLRLKLRSKYASGQAPIDLESLGSWRDFRTFDHNVTAALHGFVSVDDYYGRSSARQYLGRIEVPSLLLQARDDPFMFADVIPPASELPPALRLEVTTHGGHVGFVEGATPLRARYWLERRVPQFLAQHLPA